MMVKTRVWLGGEVRAPRDRPLLRRRIERVQRCAARRPLLVCTDGVVSDMRAIRETVREPAHTGQGGRPRLRPWRHGLIAQVVPRSYRRALRATARSTAAGITDHGWTVQELRSLHVRPPRWTPPEQRGRPSHAFKRVIERWCGDHG